MSVKVNKDFSYVGKSLDRNDSFLKTTGRAQYTADLKFPNMLYGKLIRSTVAHARIINIDTSEAEKLPGVKAIITAKDVPSMKWGLSPARFDENIFAIDKVLYVGDKIGAVCAVDEETVYKALKLIKVEYEELPAVLTWQEAAKEGAPQIFEEYPGNVNTEIHHKFGDPDAALKEAYYVRTDRLQGQRTYHAFIENHCSIGMWDGDKATLYSSCQSVHYLQYHLARVLGMKMGDLRVLKTHVGAGFGGKLDPTGLDFSALILSKMLGQPVKMFYDHEETFLNGHGRHAITMELTTGVDKNGKVLAHKFKAILDGGAYTGLGIASTYYAGSLLGVLYPIENYQFDAYRYVTNLPPCGAQRGHGQPQPRYAFEHHLDLIGEAIGVDPIDMRLVNARKNNTVTTAGYEVKSYHLGKANEMARDASGWKEKRGKLGLGRGIGVGNGGFVTGAGFCQYRTDLPHSVGMIKIYDDGTRAFVYSQAVDIGQGSDTVLLQMAAEAMGYPYEKCQMYAGDTDLTTLDFGAYASRQTLMAGWAVKRAGEDVKQKILEQAVEMFRESGRIKEGWAYIGNRELRPDDLDCKEGIVFVKQEPSLTLTFEEVARRYFVTKGVLIGRGWYHPGKLGGNHKGAAVGTSPAYSSATQIAEVKVDLETGQIECVDTWDVHDSGTIINPKLFHGQVHGAFSMGIGETIWEEVKFDDKGKLLNGNFSEYRLPTALDMPPVLSLTVEDSWEPNGPYGLKEVGEGATTPTMGCVANAIYDAIGVSMTELPITYEKVWRALKEKREKEQK
ncbi:molybdopterin cofactor-binding domain-containing protein [Pelotomaculum propionicicum]|uniref:4-hydroxybenzoyl-CoA reductase subunit alpha n=1 Tax=Pelotomaculum propionicicum TaxID=258475 RepID=A0A4Y7RTT7_9FIRM|nr:molybdopterin cofactor-binding domain-containing protein [Pelotomaculum propionicicum]NLI13353.1 molybdopterin-dependent oxidoreductase [Peptococcaceae bacterium]TEB12414.1 4-hydroxybenzoyl-CoA reductase subunit alpha [Pelotomaculum propionicicum]